MWQWNWSLFKDINVYVCAQLLNHVWLFVTPWTVALRAPLSMKFSRLEHWDGLPFPLSGDLPDEGIETASPALAGGFFTTEPPGKPKDSNTLFIIKLFRYVLFDYSVLPKSTGQSHPGYHSFSILHSHKHNSFSDLNIEILHQALFHLCFTLHRLCMASTTLMVLLSVSKHVTQFVFLVQVVSSTSDTDILDIYFTMFLRLLKSNMSKPSPWCSSSPHILLLQNPPTHLCLSK